MTKMSHNKSSKLTTAEVARQFYQQFKVEYTLFSKQIEGITQLVDQLEYTSLLLNRLLVLYFLQAQYILDNDPHYLSRRLHQAQHHMGTNYFYRQYLLPLFAQLYGIYTQPDIHTGLIGTIPVLALPIFKVQALELINTCLDIPDSAFTQIFAFFDLYTWHINADAPQDKYTLHPDILAYIFEHSVDQKQSGTYYTQEDITTYIASNTIIAYLLTDLTRSSSPAHIWHLLQNDPDRYIYNAICNPSYLSEETELEYQHRQMHYKYLYTQLSRGKIQNIDDLITYNLDLIQFADDVIRHCHNDDLVLTIYMRLKNMLILDPTCGTGAFLFAAMTTLVPLYTACIERMQEITASREWTTKDTQTHPSILHTMHTTLAQVEQHPTPQHFIHSMIITHNLYGIDIMQAAVDICQLRFSLILLAHNGNNQAKDHTPTVLLNVRHGNTLVGDIHPQSSSYAPNPVQQDTEQADTLNKPFHWHVEFPVLAQRGGFDVIIGNPPYLEYNRVRQNSIAQNFEKKSCGNLYAAVIERSLALCRREQFYLGLIVPISICGSKRFAFLRQTLSQAASSLWLANFEIFPSRLFENAFQRVSIVLMAGHPPTTSTAILHVTKILRWFTQERSHLLQCLTYTKVEHDMLVFPKFASPCQEHIIQKMLHKADGMKVATFLHAHTTRHFVYYQEATNYWIKAVCHIPYYRKNGEIMKPSHGRFLFLEQERTAKIIMALMNSSLFYIWFITYADGFHLSHALVKTFPVSLALLTSQELYDLALLLEDDIQIHAHLGTHNTKYNIYTKQAGHQIDLEKYQMRYSKHILDKIDQVLSQYYSFTYEELDFIINYDIKYRISSRRRCNP